MGALVRGSTYKTGFSCCSLPEIATAETQLDLLRRVVGILTRRLLFCVWCCDVGELFLRCVRALSCCAVYEKMYTPVGFAVHSIIKKKYIQNRTSHLIRVSVYTAKMWLFVLMSFTYVFIFAIICTS